MLHFSRYSIVSNPLPSGGYVLLNGLSGALDLVSNELGLKLASLLHEDNNQNHDRVIHCLDKKTMNSFLESGHVTELSGDEEKEMIKIISEEYFKAMQHRPSFMIVPNLDCNYRCTYCFERPIQRAITSLNAQISHKNNNVVMTDELLPKIYSAIDLIKSKSESALGGQIILYGGEPLDKKNKDIVTKIVNMGRDKGFYFAVVTNGHDIEHFLTLLGSGGIEQIQISIDGLKEIHDKRRVFVGKDSSFDKLVTNIDLVLNSSNAQIQLRVHLDPNNISHFSDVVSFFETRGWLDHPRLVLYANTVYSKDEAGQVEVKLSHDEIAKRIREITKGYRTIYSSAAEFHADKAIRPAFEKNERFKIKSTYCGANTGNYIFSPDGQIYTCWESLGKSCSRLGSYAPSLEIDQSIADRWFNRSIATLPECQQCRYALICGGGCAQYAEYNYGDLYHKYCDDFNNTFRAALANSSDYYLSQI